MGTVPILQAMAKIRPAYIVGIPGYMYHLLREAHSRSMDLSFLKGMALGGDQVTPNYRTRVKAMLESLGATNPRIVSVLGFTEARKCWSECVGEADSGFHTYPDLETWAKTQTTLDSEAGSEIVGMFEDVSHCSENRLWKFEPTK